MGYPESHLQAGCGRLHLSYHHLAARDVSVRNWRNLMIYWVQSWPGLFKTLSPGHKTLRPPTQSPHLQLRKNSLHCPLSVFLVWALKPRASDTLNPHSTAKLHPGPCLYSSLSNCRCKNVDWTLKRLRNILFWNQIGVVMGQEHWLGSSKYHLTMDSTWDFIECRTMQILHQNIYQVH